MELGSENTASPEAHLEAILGAVAETIRSFAEPGWERAIDRVLASLGDAAGANRAYLFRNVTIARELAQDEVAEWTAPGVAPTIDDPENHGLPYGETFALWQTELEAGRTVVAIAGELPPELDADLASEDIRSCLFVPVTVNGSWWGYIGFDDCTVPRRWTALEILALRTAGDALGTAIARDDLQDRIGEAEAHWRELIEHVPAVLYIDQPGEGFLTSYVSPQIESVLGIPQDEWVDVPALWEQHLHPDDQARAIREYEEYLASGSHAPLVQEYRLVRDGRVRWIRDECVAVGGPDGAVRFIEGIMRDVTAQRQLAHAFHETEDRYRHLIERLPAISYLDPVEENELSGYVSPQIEEILGCSPERWLTDPSYWHRHIHPDDEPRVWATYCTHRDNGEPLAQEYRMIRDDGRIVWIREEATLLRDGRGAPMLIQGLMYDITARKQAEAQVAFLAFHDGLTGLPNRAMFEDQLETALARARRTGRAVALMFMDLDGFKKINDTLGHDAGDELLREVARRLERVSRDTDVVARQGGDEFLLLLPDLEVHDWSEPDGGDAGAMWSRGCAAASSVASRILEMMWIPMILRDRPVEITMSIGVSLYPLDADDAASLTRHADEAMYAAKRSGKAGYRIWVPLLEPASTPALQATS